MWKLWPPSPADMRHLLFGATTFPEGPAVETVITRCCGPAAEPAEPTDRPNRPVAVR